MNKKKEDMILEHLQGLKRAGFQDFLIKDVAFDLNITPFEIGGHLRKIQGLKHVGDATNRDNPAKRYRRYQFISDVPLMYIG
jgi:hypothetical protein